MVTRMIPRDSELLRRYCVERSENAFAPLVERHLDLVYAVALRQAGDEPQVAERMTQAVFTHLAEQAETLQEHASLAGWLYSRTQAAEVDAASKQLQRPGIPETVQALSSPTKLKSSDQLDPVIAEAIEKMEEIDRQALLLHHRDGLDFRTIAAVTGLSNEEARQRVTQALEKLRGILREGGKTSAAMLKSLGTILSASGLVKPPVGLARRIAKVAVVNTVAASGLSSFWRANGTKAALVGALVLVALPVALIVKQRSRPHPTAENRAFRDQRETNRPAPASNRQTMDLSPDSAELQRLREERRELMRLRAELTQLRAQGTNPPRAELSEEKAEPSAISEQDSPVVSYFAKVSAKLARGQTMLAGGWRTASGKRTLLLVTPEVSDADAGGRQVNFQTVWVAGPDDVLTELGLDQLFTDARTNATARVLSQAQTRTLMGGLVGGTGVDVLTAPRLTTKEGMPARIDVTQSKTEGDATIQVGPAVELTHTIGADGTLDLTVNAQFSELKRTEASTEAVADAPTEAVGDAPTELPTEAEPDDEESLVPDIVEEDIEVP